MAHTLRNSLDNAWLFADLMDDEKADLEKYMNLLPFARGAKIIEEGAPHSAIWIVAEGRLDVLVAGKTVSSLAKGELFGEQAWLDGFSGSASIVAQGPTSLWQLSFRDFNMFLDAHTEAHIHILKKLAINLSQRLRQSKP